MFGSKNKIREQALREAIQTRRITEAIKEDLLANLGKRQKQILKEAIANETILVTEMSNIDMFTMTKRQMSY